MKRILTRALATLLTVSAAYLLGGCRTEDELIGRPWNTPKSWETGLPSAMTEGR
jgi:hypothetical protein